MKTTATETKTILGVNVTFSTSNHGKRRVVKNAQWYGRAASGELVAECCASLDKAVLCATVAIARANGEQGSVSDILSRHVA